MLYMFLLNICFLFVKNLKIPHITGYILRNTVLKIPHIAGYILRNTVLKIPHIAGYILRNTVLKIPHIAGYIHNFHTIFLSYYKSMQVRYGGLTGEH